MKDHPAPPRKKRVYEAAIRYLDLIVYAGRGGMILHQSFLPSRPLSQL